VTEVIAVSNIATLGHFCSGRKAIRVHDVIR
jgi:hypothetical protein